jgi:hypothetical protein
MRFSVIVLAYNEEQYLPRLLDSIEVAKSNYSGVGDEMEAIVAHNAYADRMDLDFGHKGKVFRLTDKGYEIADMFRRAWGLV